MRGACVLTVCVLAVCAAACGRTKATKPEAEVATKEVPPKPKEEVKPKKEDSNVEPPGEKPKGKPKEKAKEKEKLTVEQARKMFLGKTKDQVKAVLGKPDYTFYYDTGNGFWDYRNIIWNSESEKWDSLHLDFDADGMCTLVK